MAPAPNKIDKKSVREKVRKIFEAAQEPYGHQKLIEKCRKLKKKFEDSDHDLFLREFTAAMRYVFVYQEKTAVENILNFISKCVTAFHTPSVDQDSTDNTVDECAPFVSSVLDFLFKSHGASCPDARLRCMLLLSKILSSMPENSLISDDIWQKLKETVLCRLQDKNLAVRAQTVLTARMLQDPKNPNCEIIKALIFHFNDPSPAVRRAVISSIALNKVTISHVLARTRDINDNVRRNAYLVFSKIKAMNLTIKFRVTILERGLQDRSEMVRKCVEQIVVVNWLDNFRNDLLKFLESLDVVNCSEIAIKTIEAVLKTQPKEEILNQLPIDRDTHLIPKERMTPETVLLWRCLAHYFLKQGDDDALEAILPSLTVLCDHIREFFKPEENGSATLSEEEQWEDIKEKEILMHLFQLIKVFDLSDEMGRLKLKKLIVDILISPRISNAQIKFLVELLVPVIPNKDAYIQELTEVISEIRQPMRTVVSQLSQKEKMERDLKISDIKMALNELREQEYEAVSSKKYAAAEKLKNEIEAMEAELKAFIEQPVTLTQEVSEEKNDPITLCKCLSVLVEMIRCSGVRVLTPKLLNLKENFLDQCMASQDLLTQSLAIEACAQFCILDKDLAKDNLIRFLLMISEDGDNEISIPSLKGVFDIIHTYGLQILRHLVQSSEECEGGGMSGRGDEASVAENVDDPRVCEGAKESSLEVKCLKNLNALLFCKTNDALMAVAYEGLCKLLLSGVIYSPSILSRIVIKGFSPIIDCEYEDFIRQTFMVFFPIFASNTPRSQEMIEAAFIPTIKTLSNAALGTPDADINPKDVMAFLIDHTKPHINKFTLKTLHVHNNLVLSICHEIYREICDPKGSTYLTPLYLRSLNQLEISVETESFLHQLNTLTDKIEKNLTEASCIRSLFIFKRKLEEKLHVGSAVPSVENTLVSTRSSKRAYNEDLSDVLSCSARKCSKPSLEATSKSSMDDTDCPTSTKTSRVVIPESPEISD